jgi:hypothetical protein
VKRRHARPSFPLKASFPPEEAGKVLAHVERRCRARCPYCTAERLSARVTRQLEESLCLLKEKNND